MAISGLMFVMAALFVSGKQANAEFKQGMNEINTKVQQIISDVGNGYYPSSENFTCSVSGTSQPVISPPSGGATAKGSQYGCTFIGKIVVFDTNTSKYNVYSLAGRQYSDNNGSPVYTITDAKPVAIISDGIDTTEHNTLQWGLTVTGVKDYTTGSQIGALAFLSSFPSDSSGATGSVESSSQTVQVYSLPTTFTDGSIVVGTPISEATFGSPVQNPHIVVCFDGGRGLYGALTIGGSSGNGLSTDVQTYTDKASWQSQGKC